MDIITVGLDFGTHQTKICVKTYPNEDIHHPIFDFFTFKDLNGKESYFLPSIVQINEDETISYGYIKRSLKRKKCRRKTNPDNNLTSIFKDIDFTASQLYNKYSDENNSPEDRAVLVKMLQKYKNIFQKKKTKTLTSQPETYDSESYFKYFKQATFSERVWNKNIASETISIWYLAYILFLLEEKFGSNFGINMGIPVGEKNYSEKKKYATSILLSAYNLVENVFKNDFASFLRTKVDTLLEKTKKIEFTTRLKKLYNINIFPEAYAGLTTLTYIGKITEGMSIIADIGGGTTDISFFTLTTDHKPCIYRYWSIPKGLNYIAEISGFDYSQDLMQHGVKDDVVKDFISSELDFVNKLIDDLLKQLNKETDIPKGHLLKALKDRVIVYNGGGSTEKFLLQPLDTFTDIKSMDANMWKETNIKNKKKVEPLCQLLTTAYGLAIGRSDKDVNLSPFTMIFNGLKTDPETKHEIPFIDKDVC